MADSLLGAEATVVKMGEAGWSLAVDALLLGDAPTVAKMVEALWTKQ